MKLITKTPYIAIMLRTSSKTYREIMHGILQYVRRATPWAIRINTTSENSEEQSRLGFDREKYSGVIIDETNDLFHNLEKFDNSPIVTIISQRPPKCFPKNRVYIYCDNNAIGEMAAKFLVGKGFRSFGYVNFALGLPWSHERGEAFSSTLGNAGFTCEVYDPPTPKSSDIVVHDRPRLAKWLRELPKPIALFVANDMRAVDVFAACRTEGIAIPQDIAILSCDDDELICETTNPPLSSIRFSTETAGFKAAALLDRLVRRKNNIPQRERLLSYGPASVAERLSCESVAHSDPLVEKALALIRLNAMSGLHVNQLVRQMRVSRRALEIRFKSTLRRSIYDEILRIRMDKACDYLREGTLRMEEIAERCGFPDASHLGVMFKRRIGMTPTSYKRLHTLQTSSSTHALQNH